MNDCKFMGRVVNDKLVLKEVGENKAKVLEFSIAEEKKINGEKIVTYINLQIWGHGAEHLSKNLKKGSRILVDSYYKQDKYVKDNENRYRSYFVIKGFNIIDWNVAKNEDIPTSYEDTPFAIENK